MFGSGSSPLGMGTGWVQGAAWHGAAQECRSCRSIMAPRVAQVPSLRCMSDEGEVTSSAQMCLQ